MTNLEDRRLGLRAMFTDNAATWTMQLDDNEARADRRRAFAWFYGVPVLTAAPFLIWHVHLGGLGQILSGVSVFTALLFGLLGVIFNLGVTLRKDGAAIASAHDLRQVVGDLRANVTYSIIVGVTLAGSLVVAAATTPANQATPWGYTPAVVGLFVHLALNLLAVLRRFRTAFNYITR